MFRRGVPISVFFMLLCCVPAARALSIEELVAKHVEARGGTAQLQALQSLRLTGKFVVTGDFGLELQFVEVIKRPGLIRDELALQGLTAVQAWDGSEGWQISPFQGRKDPERMSPDDAKSLVDGADLDGPLVDWQRKGFTAEYVGTEDVDGTDAHKVRLTQKNGDVQTVFLDPDFFLVIRVLYQRIVRGVQVESETDFGNYERISGVLIPFSRESGPRGGTKNQKVLIEKAEPNVPIDAAVFTFPAGHTK
jgi:hypothetical protein